MANPRLLLDITVPEDRHLVLLTGGGADEPPHEYQFRITTRGGEGRWIERVCQPVHRDDGEFLGWRTSNRDVPIGNGKGAPAQARKMRPSASWRAGSRT